MALTPTTVPTSFVPKQPVGGNNQKYTKSGGNTFLIASLVLLGASLIGSGGVFAYEKYLEGVRDGKAEAVRTAQANVDTDTVEEFVRMRNRFTVAQGVLDAHVSTTAFFDLLERVTLQSVRFDTLSFTLAEDRSAKIQMSGVARTFNALAAQSSSLAGEKLLKRAIFSDIAVDEETDTVTFTLNADLDSRLLEFSVDGDTMPAPEVAPAEPADESALPAEEAPTAAPESTSTQTP